MYELKKMERYLRVNLLGPGPRLMKKRIYRASVSQRLRNTALVSGPVPLREKRPWREADHSATSSDNAMNARSSVSTSPRDFMACIGTTSLCVYRHLSFCSSNELELLHSHDLDFQEVRSATMIMNYYKKTTEQVNS